MKDLKISKELIKAVLEKETQTLSKDFNFTINEDYIEFSDDGEMQFEYCIYKFAFKCKEWASNLGYQIISGPSDEQAYRKNCEQAYSEVFWYEGDDVHRTYKNELFLACTEQEAIIIASEWVLSEVNK